MNVRLGYAKPASYTGFMLLGFFIGVAVFVLWQFHIEPVYGWINLAMLQLVAMFEGATAPVAWLISRLQSAFASNPVACITASLSAVGVIYGLYSKIQSIRRENQAAEAYTNQAIKLENQVYEKNEELKQLVADKADLEGKITELEADKSGEMVGQLEQTITQKNTEINRLQGEVRALHDQIQLMKVQVHETVKVK